MTFNHAFHDLPDVNDSRANHPIDNPSAYWRISLYFVFLDHLVGEITNRLLSNEERFLASFYIPSKLANLTPDIADRIYATYRSDLGDKNEFDDEIARWKTRWSLEDEKPGRLLDILNVTDPDLYPSIYRIIWILLTMPVSSATSERSFIFSAMQRAKSFI